MRVHVLLLLSSLALALAGCDGGGGPGWASYVAPPGAARGVRPVVRLSPASPLAVDPELAGFDGWPIAFDVSGAPAGARCSIEVRQDGAIVPTPAAALEGTSCETSWDGRGPGGARLPSGPLAVTATVTGGAIDASTTVTLALVRVGIVRIELAGAAGARQPLLYRRTGGVPDGFYEVDASTAPFAMGPGPREAGASALAHADGSPRAIPAVWTDLLSPPLDPLATDGVEHASYALPTAWVAGSEMDLRAHGAAMGVPEGISLRVVPPTDTTIAGDDAFRDGALITLHTSGSVVPAVGRFEVPWAFSFEVRAPDGEWQPLPGTFTVTLRFYGLAGAPALGFTTLPHRPWIDVVDRIAGWIDGAASDPVAVGALLVQHVYYDTGLRYDTMSGASAYTDYPRAGFGGAVFYAQDYEDRGHGTTVNCSDAASILSTYGNMVGVDFGYHILTSRLGIDHGFDLDFIRAIGMPAFDDTPFDSGRGSFRYHAIVGGPDGRTFDATLALDGDANPAASPFELLLAQDLDASRYLNALSSEASNIRTDLDEKVRLR